MNARPGFTLLEMIVALAILGTLASIAMPVSANRRKPRPNAAEILAESLRVAILSCRSVGVEAQVNGRTVHALAECDGSTVADSEFSRRREADDVWREK